ncbi:MAG: hypothetical protein J6Z36_03315 [Clostridia bacterium]|nr:hypothetical protein [Clostridia bacterium]
MAKTFKELAREAKSRLKSGFWVDCKQNLEENLTSARERGVNETRAERFFAEKITASLNGAKEDEFYLRVKELLLTEGEVSNAIGRLTDKAYYDGLSYEEKQRYNLSLSEKYLKALERFRRENEFASLKTIEK